MLKRRKETEQQRPNNFHANLDYLRFIIEDCRKSDMERTIDFIDHMEKCGIDILEKGIMLDFFISSENEKKH